MMFPHPIAIFAFKRPVHLARTLEALAANPEAATAAVTIYCDGPRHPAEEQGVAETRRVAHAVGGFASVSVVEQATNLGLAESIIAGVTDQVSKAGTVIVLEDDLVVSRYFLRYMREGLELYRDDPKIASIHAYRYPGDALTETFFLRGADCWGWATWARAWTHFRHDGPTLLSELRTSKLAKEFDLGGAGRFTEMLEDQIAGRVNSWAVRWHASCFLAGLLTLYPGRSLVVNIGNDATGTHSKDTDAFDAGLAETPISVHRIAQEESEAARKVFADFLHPGRLRATAARLRRMLRCLGTS